MIHLIGNAHLDPAWMWTLEEGMEAFAATCRSALDRIAECKELIFTCSSAAHYEYVERTDPSLFSRIQKAVETGRWAIVGGWWVEADCNLPSGESLIRQALMGQRYFESRFGIRSTVGYNIDSFGHNANLPSLLSTTGLQAYVCMRPEEHEMHLPASYFLWRSPSGDGIPTYRIPLHYSSFKYNVAQKLERLPFYPLFEDSKSWMLFFGVGNHGGGPTIAELNRIHALQSQREDILLSRPEAFFAQEAPATVYSGELNPHAIGAYSANVEFKRRNRYAEQLLLRAERLSVMAKMSGIDRPEPSLSTAWQSLLLTQFHDLLGGVAIREAMEEAASLQLSVTAVASNRVRELTQSIAARIETNAIQNLIVVNDSLRPRTEWIEFELWHPEASERNDILESVELVNPGGQTIATQKIQPSGMIGEDRVRFLAKVTAPSFGWKSFEVIPRSSTSHAELPIELPEVSIGIAHDDADTWAHGLQAYEVTNESFIETGREIFETGPYRAGHRLFYQYGHSSAEIEFLKYVDEPWMELRVHLNWQEPGECAILNLRHGLYSPTARYEIPHAWIDRPADGREYPGQTWFDVFDEITGTGLAIVNASNYSFSVNSTAARITLARSKPFAYHVPPHKTKRTDRVRYTDLGEHDFRFLILPHDKPIAPSTLQHLSDWINHPLHCHLESRHGGVLANTASLMELSAATAIETAIKPAEEGNAFVMRTLECDGERQSATLRVCTVEHDLTLNPRTIQTWKIIGSVVVPVNGLEESL